MTSFVNLKQLHSTIDSHQIEYKGETEDDSVKFRTYKRSDFHKACGASSTSVLSNKIPELTRLHKEETGEDIKFGFQPTPGGVYEYTLDEVYKIIELCRKAEKQAKKRGKLSVQKKFRRSRARIISIANQKGGAGKSTSAMHIAVSQAIMSFAEARILVVDYDPQGTVHSFVEGTYLNLQETKTLCRYLMNEYVEEHDSEAPDADNDSNRREFIRSQLIRKTHIPNLHYCVALTKDNALEGHLAQLEHGALDEFDENTFNKDMQGSNVYRIFKERFTDLVAEDYDFIIIDSAPHNNTFIKTMLYSVDHLVVTAPTKAMDFESTLNFIKSTDEAFEEFKTYDDHPGLNSLTLLPVMYSNTESSREILTHYNTLFGDHTFPFPITQKTALYESMASENLTIYSYSNDITPTKKDCRMEWDKFNDFIRLKAMDQYLIKEVA